MNLEKIFRLDVKKLIFIAGGFFAAVILHNLFYALTGIEEGVFFIIAVFLIPLYAIISIIYTVYSLLTRKKK